MNVTFGAIDDVGSSLGRYVVMTQPIPWGLVKDRIGGKSVSTNMISSLDYDFLQSLIRNVPQVDYVIGIGGGVSIDAAKYLAWERKCPAIFAPTIVSVDAYATPMAGVRRSERVAYEGDVTPERLIIDFKAIKSAPKSLNRAGCGDVFSCKTALFDWELARKKNGEAWHEEAARGSRGMLQTLSEKAPEIKDVTDEGIRALVNLHLESWRVQKLANSPRPQEGSEHLFFYSLEEMARKPFLHGSAVGTGIFAMRHFQAGDEEEAGKMMDRFGLGYRPADYGLTKDEFSSALLHMKEYASYPEYKSMIAYTIVNEVNIKKEDADELWKKLS